MPPRIYPTGVTLYDPRRAHNGYVLFSAPDGKTRLITAEGQVVWEYVNPYFGRQSLRGREVSTNWVYRAVPVPYDWVPAGTPRSERPVDEVDVSTFRVPARRDS